MATDSFYSYNMVVVHWACAVDNRLEGPAGILLEGELDEVADDALRAADNLAAR